MSTREKFDPAAWVAWAERLGYQVYLWDTYGDGCLGMSTVEPDRSRGWDEEDELNLWRALRGSEDRDNERQLWRYLWDSGRVGPPEWRPAYAERFTIADVGRPSPRHHAALKRAGITST
jgi:hypothetical protein